MFGGTEGGILAKPVYELYGETGLVALTIFAFFVLLGGVWFLSFTKRNYTQEQVPKIKLVVLVASVILFFLGEAYLMGVTIQNFLVPLLLPSLTLLTIQHGVTLTYFVSAIFFTRTEMRQLMRD